MWLPSFPPYIMKNCFMQCSVLSNKKYEGLNSPDVLNIVSKTLAKWALLLL